MTAQPSSQSFFDRAKGLFQSGMRHHVVAQKGERKVVDLPVNLVLLAALLAIWLVAILWIVGMLYGFEIRVVDTEPGLEPPTGARLEPEPGIDDPNPPESHGEETL